MKFTKDKRNAFAPYIWPGNKLRSKKHLAFVSCCIFRKPNGFMKTKTDETCKRARIFYSSLDNNHCSSKEENFSNPLVRKKIQIISRGWNSRLNTEALTNYQLDIDQVTVILKITVRKTKVGMRKA